MEEGRGGNQAAASVWIEIVRGAYGFFCQIPYSCRKAQQFLLLTVEYKLGPGIKA